ncbi:hypothetical protein NE237_017148 [Protea cynaroides]|uniref:RRM domain-containing protein n=1 Tax=Protea cynaroides TaxID=273540 RepID=A0A9Q0K7H3_9MAGN|nr:hypothetical protein NE237_017148 [Protea cynaroides]
MLVCCRALSGFTTQPSSLSYNPAPALSYNSGSAASSVFSLWYQSRLSAVSARNSLQGRNIYDGCCTLDIQFSNLSELQVNSNNEWSRDFTNSSLPSEQQADPLNLDMVMWGACMHFNLEQVQLRFRRWVLLRLWSVLKDYFEWLQSGRLLLLYLWCMNYLVPTTPWVPPQRFPYPKFGPDTVLEFLSINWIVRIGNTTAIATAFVGGLPPGISGTNDRCTVLASNLNSEMSDGFQTELAVNFLKGAMLFGKRLEVNFSKHPSITSDPDTHEYSTSYLNRFNRNAAKNYRYCCSPTKMIHLSSLPEDITEDEIMTHLEDHGNIVNTKVFESNGKKQALVLFETEEQATEALVCKHASTIDGSVIRISFSQLQSI